MPTNTSVNQNLLKMKSDLKTQQIVEAYFHIGNIHRMQGRFDKAIESYNKCVLLKPDYTNAYFNMALILKNQGEFDKSIEIFMECISYNPNYVEAYNNIGNILKDQGKIVESIQSFTKAISINPNYADAWSNMGTALMDQGKIAKAIEAYNKAISIKPEFAEAYNNLGIAFKKQNKLEEAIIAFEKSLSFKPDYVLAWLNGADALEKWNKLERLAIWLKKACQTLEKIPSSIEFYKAKLLWRNKKFKESYDIIASIDYKSIPNTLQRAFFILKAQCFDKREDFDNAFDYFSRSNLLLKQSRDYVKCNPEKYFQNLKDQLKKLKKTSSLRIKPYPIENNFKPVFLVGFPRSGTTLLDTILRSHSKIDFVEEQPAVSNVMSFFKSNGYNEIINKKLPQQLLVKANEIYISEFKKHLTNFESDNVYIDKLPLNIVNIPLIQILYPNAKFILALRHPMDTIFSCWMQDFKLNQAMANMVDLDRIVDFYDVAMSTFKLCKAKYKLQVYEIKYENLLTNFNEETSALLKFLGLKWEPQVLNYRETALKRGRINTPSYSQVIQPIYKSAIYRWINYEKYLEKYMKQLSPWINDFGYKH